MEKRIDLNALRSRALGQVGAAIYYYQRVGSTNEVLRTLVRQGVDHGTTVVADEQTAGRGRRNRRWVASPASSLLFSVYLADINPHLAIMVAALAVRDAVQEKTGLSVDIKWPNDLLIAGRKFCGILGERCAEGVIVGIGVNVNMGWEELATINQGATSLQVELTRPLDRTQLLAAILDGLEVRYRQARQVPDKIFAEWRSALSTLGRIVEIHEAKTIWEGKAVDVAQDGALLVAKDKDMVRVYAADVSIRSY
jgi:BirA family biotin operon repressor/biotin-[acetyl-CoA-carboxylase] ligase